MLPKLQAAKSRSEKFMLAFALFVMFGFSLNFWGINANGIVTIANNQTMPVVSEKFDLIMPQSGTERAYLEDGRLLLLADRFRIDFPQIEDHIPSGPFGRALHWWITHLNYPAEGGLNIVSIGDVMRWVGTILFLPLLPLLVILIPFRARANMRMYGNWRGKA